MLSKIILYILLGLYGISFGVDLADNFIGEEITMACTDIDTDEGDNEEYEEDDERTKACQVHGLMDWRLNFKTASWPRFGMNDFSDIFSTPELRPPLFKFA